MQAIDNRPILVIGGTGKTGRRIADRLLGKGIQVRLGSRTAEPAFDWQDRSGWAQALDGVRAAYIAYFPDIAAPGALEDIRAFTDLAVTMGVTRLVLLSGRGELEAQQAEDVLKASGATWTILRCSWFSQNFSEGFLFDMVNAGNVALPADEVLEPFIDVSDIADAAVIALTEPGHENRLYEMTGPRLLTFRQAVDEIAAAAGRQIDYTHLTLEEFDGGLVANGVPEDYRGLLTMLFTVVLDGRNESVTSGARDILGREPRDFASVAREEAASGTWGGLHHANQGRA
jgi:uncharacterized protein YbjT (DUF2867 family)